MGESTTSTTLLIRNIGKFDGTDFATWQRTVRAMIKIVHKLLDDLLRPEPLYRTSCGRGRPATRGVSISRSALAGVLEGEEPTPGGEGSKGGRRYENISSVAVPSMVTVPPTDEVILTNGAEFERWDVCNKKLYSILFLSTKGAVNSFLVCFAGGPDPRQQPDGQAGWKAMNAKYLNSSRQRWRILMRKLNGMVMMHNQDPD